MSASGVAVAGRDVSVGSQARQGGERPGVSRYTDPHAVLQRQVAIASVILLSLLMFIRVDINADHPWMVVLAVAMVLAATALAFLLKPPDRPRLLLIAIPLIDLLAVGLLRFTTGGGTSLFGALLVLPCISLGIERGRLPVAVAALGCAAVIGVPVLLTESTDDPLRVLSTPLVLMLTALTVNVLTRRLRRRNRSENRLRRELEALLAEAEQNETATVQVATLLRQSAALMSSVVDAVTEQFIIATDAAGQVELFNRGAERMLALSALDALGHPLVRTLGDRFVLRPARTPGVAPDGPRTLSEIGFEALVADARHGRAAASTWTYRRPGGTKVTVEVSVTVRVDRAEGIGGFLIVGTDVSEMYEQARLKDEFVSLISHELRTPLSSILGYLELVTDDEDAPLSEDQKQYLEIVERNAHRLLRLVGDLLFTASLEAGKLNLQTAEVDLGSIAASAVLSAQPAAAAAGILVTLTAPNDPVLIQADATRIGQVCDNLLSNAIKFTPRDGTIEVALTPADPFPGGRPIRLAVRDSGLGIPAAELDQLFARFFRTTTATTHAVPGIGLGLSISRAIAIAHGGEIRVASTPGEGSVFTLELPAPTPAPGVPGPLVPSSG